MLAAASPLPAALAWARLVFVASLSLCDELRRVHADGSHCPSVLRDTVNLQADSDAAAASLPWADLGGASPPALLSLMGAGALMPRTAAKVGGQRRWVGADGTGSSQHRDRRGRRAGATLSARCTPRPESTEHLPVQMHPESPLELELVQSVATWTVPAEAATNIPRSVTTEGKLGDTPCAWDSAEVSAPGFQPLCLQPLPGCPNLPPSPLSLRGEVLVGF